MIAAQRITSVRMGNPNWYTTKGSSTHHKPWKTSVRMKDIVGAMLI